MGAQGRWRWPAWLGLVAALLGAVILLKDVVAKTALLAGVKAMTGLPVRVQRVHVGVLKRVVQVEGFVIENPEGFPEPAMLDIPELFVEYRIMPFFSRKIHLSALRLNLKEFTVIRNQEGRLNVEALKAASRPAAALPTSSPGAPGTVRPLRAPTPAPRESKTAPPQFQIDELELRIGRVVYKDYARGGTPLVQEFSLSMNERYRNVSSPAALASLVLVSALTRTTIAQVTRFDLSGLKRQVGGVLDRATGVLEGAVGAAGSAVEGTASSLKQILPLISDETGARR